MRINFRAIGLFIFAEIILFLAGAYFGRIFRVMFYTLMVYPIVSVLFLFLWFYLRIKRRLLCSSRKALKSLKMIL